MKLALYLPNFRDKVTVKELEDLTEPPRSSTSTRSGRSTGSSSRKPPIAAELQYSFGMMERVPEGLAGVRTR